MTATRWGVVGCGQIAADKTIPAIAASVNAALAAVADVRDERLDAVREQYAVPTYRDYRELLASPEVDVVYVAVPNELHHAVTVAAADRGKHVLCEKPLALSAREAREMIAACASNGVKLMTAYMARFSDAFADASAILSTGRLGPVAMINANFSFGARTFYTPEKPGFWRWSGKRGGPLLDAGVYLAFTIRELMASRVRRVSAGMWPVLARDRDAPDTVVAWFELEDGTPGILSTTYSHNQAVVEFHGTAGVLSLRGCFSQKPGGSLHCRAGTFVVETNYADGCAEHFAHYRREVEHFSDAVLHDRTYRPTPQEALDDMSLLDAIEESARTRQVIDVTYQ